MESFDVGCRHSIYNLKEAPAKVPQPIKGWAVVEEVLDSPQLHLIATYPAKVWLESVLDLRQRPNLAVPLDKSDN